jgi:aryl-alcohol dehydrogenase-like predicted oxidoreductase
MEQVSFNSLGRELTRSRTIERDLLPMARHYNMAIIPWSAVGSGRFRNPPQLQEAIDNGTFNEDDDNVKYSRKLFDIGKRRGIESFAPVALAYLFAKYPLVFPIVGFQTPEVSFSVYSLDGADEKMLHQNIKALEMKLTPEEIKEIEGTNRSETRLIVDLKPLEHSFPHDMTGDDPRLTGQPGGNIDLQMGTIDWLVDQRVYASQLNL